MQPLEHVIRSVVNGSSNKFICFKFQPVNKYLIDSLVNSTLHFSSRNELNDPFDSQIQIQHVIAHVLGGDLPATTRSLLEQLQKEEQFFQTFYDGYKHFGICSFSTALDETLMWSHYADRHRGVALTYVFPETFLNNPDEIVGAVPVNYESDSVSSWIKNNAHLIVEGHQEFVIGLLKRVLTAKAPAWRYECEGRIIRPTTGPYEVPRSTLRQITFGLRTEPSDERLLRSLATRYFEGLKFNRVVRSGSDFGLEIVDAP